MSEESNKRFTEKMMNVPIFTADGWDVQDESDFSFYHVDFLLPELKKYNGLGIDFTRSGDLDIWNDDGTKSIFKGNIGQFKSFRDKLNKLYEGVME